METPALGSLCCLTKSVGLEVDSCTHPRSSYLTKTTIVSRFIANVKHAERQSENKSTVPDLVKFYTSCLKHCGESAALFEGKRLHAHIIHNGLERNKLLGNLLVGMYGKCADVYTAVTLFGSIQHKNVFSWTILIDVYAQSGNLKDAKSVFEEMPERNVVAWNIMIAACNQHDESTSALRLFEQMELEGIIPDRISFINALDSCASHFRLHRGKLIHVQILSRGLDSDIIIGNTLINMYNKCASLSDAQNAFETMPSRNVVSWSTIISSYAQHGKIKVALHLFEEMKLEGVMLNEGTFVGILDACAVDEFLDQGKRLHGHICRNGFDLDVIVGTAIVSMYGKCGRIHDAYMMFDRLLIQDPVSQNAMITAFVQYGQGKEALKLFEYLRCGAPDKVMFINTLDACANELKLVQGKRLHTDILTLGFESDTMVANALINMYGKCGCLHWASKVFCNMHQHDVVSWNSMVNVYAQCGQGKRALELFHEMRKEKMLPNNVTFVSLLDACASMVAVNEGKNIHFCIINARLESDFLVENALLNMYGKCGSLEDAWKVFTSMSKRNVITWSAIIAAHAQQGQVHAALELFGQMQNEGLLPNAVTMISALYACSHAGLLDRGYYLVASYQHFSTFTVDHFNCMMDLTIRSGWLDEAEDLVNNMPFHPTAASWATLLGACRLHLDLVRAGRLAAYVFQQDPE